LVAHGSSQSFSIAPDPGYQVDSLVVDGAALPADTSYTFTNVTAAHSIRATFMVAEAVATVDAVTPAQTISPNHPSVTVPVRISRAGTSQARTFSVTFRLSSHLTLPAGLASITEGDFLSGGGRTTQFQATDLGGGLYRADGTILGEPCGSDRTLATLFDVALSSAATSAVDTVTVLGWSLRTCDDSKLPAGVGAAATVHVDYAPPVVAVTSPNGGEFWTVHSPRNLAWTAEDDAGVASVDLAYSVDGGVTWPDTIATGVANTGSYAWTVPNALSATARVRVTAHDVNGNSAPDASDASFTINLYSLTATAAAHGSIDPPSAAVAWGADQPYTIVPDAGYHVDSLLVDGAPVTPATHFSFTDVTADHSIRAIFAVNVYTIAASAGAHGAISPSGSVPVNHGASQEFEILPDTGYHVDSLVVDGVPVPAAATYSFTNVTGNHTIHATFAINDFTIVASAGGHGRIDPEGTVGISYGGSQAFTIVPDTGYHVDSLYVDGAPVTPATQYTFTNVTADHTLHATFAINLYTIAASAGAHGAIDPVGSVAVPHGGSRTFTITPDTGYHVDSLIVDGSPVTPATEFSFTNVTAGHSIRASFAIDVFTIAASAGPHGSIDPSGAVPVDYGADRGFSIAPATGYHLDSLVVDGQPVPPVASYTFTNVTTNHVIHATFAIDVFAIVASAGAHGGIAPSGSVAVPYGGSQAFTLTADAGWHLDSLIVDDAPVEPVSPFTFTFVTTNHLLRATFAVNPAVSPIALLAATPQSSGNGSGSTTRVHVTWPAVGAGSTVEIYRAGFGNYPEYDDGPLPGSVPPLPTAYPPAGRWALAGSVAAPGTALDDRTSGRDYWYYVAIVTDRYGTHSPISNMTTGTLNYHLGDVVDPADTLAVGDNAVSVADVSLLGAHYGASLEPGSRYNVLDVGPTADYSPNRLPTTDNVIDFEDLVVFALTFGGVSAPLATTQPAADERDELRLEAADRATAGRELPASLVLRSAGTGRGIATKLTWDPEVVAPVGFRAGALAESQGAVVLSSRPGTVDAVVLGAGAGFRGAGEVAVVTFRGLKAGDPRIRLSSADARDLRNAKLDLATSERTLKVLPTVTQLAPAMPNPFRQSTTIAFSLAQGGPVELRIFSVDGRRVRTLVKEAREPGEYRVTWDGRDDLGQPMSAGIYYAQLKAAQRGFTRTLTYLK
jgi:hypothetical protein